MQKEGVFTAKNLNDKLFCLLLAIVLMSACIYLYLGSYVNAYSVTAALFTAALFALYSFIYKLKKPLGFILYILILIVFYNIMSSLLAIRSGYRRETAVNIAEWFFSAGEAVETSAYYMRILVTGFTFFISSALFYFTTVIYRPLFVLLISLIPCLIHVRTEKLFPIEYLVIIAALNLFIYLKNCRSVIEKEAITVSKKSVFVCYTDFAVAAVILAFIIPKPSTTPFYERFNELTARFALGRVYVGHEGQFTRFSGNADALLLGEEQLLYMVITDSPAYYKIQVFHSFNEESNWWEAADGISGDTGWEAQRRALNMGDLHDAYRHAARLSPELTDKYAGLLELDVRDARQFAQVRAIEYRSAYVISPARVTSAEFFEQGVSKVYRSESGEMFTDLDILPPFASYNLYYYSDAFFKESGWLDAGGGNFSFDEYGQMLLSTERLLRGNGANAQADTVSAFIEEHNRAKINRAENFSDVPERIKQLALEITEPYDYDWQKAEALEAFFHKGDFTYDLSYTSARNNNSVEFFLFNSRRGTCSDFASAFSLMARGAGLTVRYAEGFVSEEVRQFSLYRITTETAHAYPEVYIPGAGWMVYEPTVPNLLGRRRAAGADGGNIDAVTAAATALSAVIVAALILIGIFLRPRLLEAAFRVKVKYTTGKKAVILLHARHSAQLKKLFSIDTNPLTAEQTAAHLRTLTGGDSHPLLDAFTKVCYGEKDISADEKNAAFRFYKEQYALLRQQYKQNKQNKRNNNERWQPRGWA